MKQICTILACALAMFLALLFQYWLVAHNPISSRVHFALFMSLLPAVFCLVVLRKPVKVVVALYFTLFITLQILWALIHG